MATRVEPAAQSWSVKSYLMALALACTLPIAVVAGWFALHLVQDAVEAERADVTSRLYLLRDAVDQGIEGPPRLAQLEKALRTP